MADAVISISSGEFNDPKTGQKTVLLELTNQGNEPLTIKKIEWVYFYEKPVDATEEFLSKHGQQFEKDTGRKIIKAEETGRRYTFGPVEENQQGPLSPDESRSFFFSPDWLPEMLSIAQALSPERYWIEISLNDNQIEKLSGKSFGGFLEEHFTGG